MKRKEHFSRWALSAAATGVGRMETFGYSVYRCDAEGCRSNGTNQCISCSRHFCDRHMLQTRLEGTHIGAIMVEACATCTDRAVDLYTRQGAYVSSWRRKAAGTRQS